jgi:hypothetical protein
MERACMLYDLTFIYCVPELDFSDDFIELLCRASEEQAREIGYDDDPDAAALMMEAADQGHWRRRGPVQVLTEAQRVGTEQFDAVRTPTWREEYERHRRRRRESERARMN